MSRLRRLAAALILLALAGGVPARGDLTVTVGSVSVTQPVGQSQTVYLDVTGSGASLDNYGVEFLISGGTNVTPQFVNNPSASGDPTLTDSRYVFTGNSLDADPANNFPFGTASPKTANGSLVSFVGGDSTLDGANASLATHPLLARLKIQTPAFLDGGLTTEQFTISLVPGANTYFLQNVGGVDTAVPVSNASNLSGTITVQTTMTVAPEANTLAAGLLIAAGLGGVTWFRNARRLRRSPS